MARRDPDPVSERSLGLPACKGIALLLARQRVRAASLPATQPHRAPAGIGPYGSIRAGQSLGSRLCRPPALLPGSCASSGHLAVVGVSSLTCPPPVTGNGSVP